MINCRQIIEGVIGRRYHNSGNLLLDSYWIELLRLFAVTLTGASRFVLHGFRVE